MLDRATFLRPIAHRGLHDVSAGIVENTGAAFLAAIGAGYGIECDVRPAAGGLAVVFHDQTLDRLTHETGQLAQMSSEGLHRIRFRADPAARILTLAQLLELVDGRVPLLVEVKSEWEPPDSGFLSEIARLTAAYEGALALMSFDPAVMAALRVLAPNVPRGIVSGLYRDEHGETWWGDRIDENRAYRLAHLLEAGPAGCTFFAYHVKALPTPVTRFVREVMGVPLFTWTVRDEDDRVRAAQWADAPIFEGFRP